MNTEHRLRVDTHVHFHACFDEEAFFDAALSNLGVVSSDSGLVHGALCLTETSDAHWFRELAASAAVSRTGTSKWKVDETEESNSLLATHNDGRMLAIIAGRQIVTEERLEVLALGMEGDYADGPPLLDVLKAVEGAGAIPVVPWGFGKWLGRRGDLVEQVMDEPPCPFLLGDNGGRPAILRKPRLLEESSRRGFAVLPGTDPFPFSWDCRRVGSFGIEWRGGLSPATPFGDLQRLVRDSAGDARPYGHLENLPGFIRNQVAIQLKNRMPRVFS